MANPSKPTTRLQCNGFEAWIVVGDKDLEGYGAENGEREASCWVASETDKKFSVNFRRLSTENKCHFSSHVYVDGVLASAYLTRKEEDLVEIVDHARISPTEARDFMFGSLELLDDDTLLANAPSASIGEIKVILCRASILPSSKLAFPSVSIPEATKVHERSKKGLAHRVKFGDARKVTNNEVIRRAIKHEVSATFTFKYRPLAMLQANGIAPHTPPLPAEGHPSSLSSAPRGNKRKLVDIKRELDDDDDDDEEELVGGDDAIITRRKELRAELDKIEEQLTKRKAGKRPKKEVKIEPATYSAPGEVIDLTID